MNLTHGVQQYELPDQWWNEAGMGGFVPTRRAYRVDTTSFPGLPVLELPITDVEPVLRQLSHGVFNDSPEFGTAKERVVRVLSAFRQDVPLPPVEVLALPTGSQHAFRLAHGAHRFYSSLAAGFSSVPAVDVSRWSKGTVVNLDDRSADRQ